MEMKKFMNYEEEELISFIRRDNITIKIRFITESDHTTKIYYDEYRHNEPSFGLNMFRSISIPYDASGIVRSGRSPVSASTRADNNSPYPWRD